jgi:hypothetical protein
MAALTDKRMTRETRFKNKAFPLDASTKVFQGGIACGDTATGLVTKAQAATGLLKIGEFAESVDNSSGAAGALSVLVSLDREVIARWYDNDTGTPVAAANVFSDCYLLDDHTVTATSAGHSVAGRVWAVDSVKGVLVESYNAF